MLHFENVHVLSSFLYNYLLLLLQVEKANFDSLMLGPKHCLLVFSVFNIEKCITVRSS